MDEMRRFWLNRTACSVLDELRQLLKARGLKYGAEYSLIEELQVMYNRMEAALADKRQIEEINEERHMLKQEYKKLYNKVKKLKDKK